jgi:hypothetical protein
MFALFFSIIACLAPKNVNSSPGIPTLESKETQDLTVSDSNVRTSSNVIVEGWSGRVYSDEADQRKTFLIQNEQQLTEFVAKIPAVQIQKTNPAPPSDDPLRNGKVVDFTAYVMVISLRFDNMYATSDITSVNRGEAGFVVHVRTPPVGETAMLSSMMGIGTYSAALIPNTKQAIRFEHHIE